MLTIGHLASYAGVTVRAVRHYHQIGLLPEPERDASGYRTYDAAAVVRLIRIRTLAEAGVPLADPDVVRLYQLIGRIAENGQDEELLHETADLMNELLKRAADSGELDRQDEFMPDEAFIRLMDSFADASHPAVARLRELIAERGWTGWTRMAKREPEASHRA